MVREDEIRAAERAIEWPEATDAGLTFIGCIHTPWTSRMDCPRQGRHDGPTRRVLESPRDDGVTRGTFSLRSPVRPNPIGSSIVKLIGLEGATLLVRGLDCLNGTPLLDLKPDRSLFTPCAPPTPGDSNVAGA